MHVLDLQKTSRKFGDHLKLVRSRHMFIVLGSTVVLLQGLIDCCAVTESIVAICFGTISLVTIGSYVMSVQIFSKHERELGALLRYVVYQ